MMTIAPGAKSNRPPATQQPSGVGTQGPIPHRKRRGLRFLLALLPVAAVIIAFELLRRQLEQHNFHEIAAGIRDTPVPSLLLGALVTSLAYLAVTGYDWLALRYIESPLPYFKSAPISLLAYGVSNALGFPLFTSTPIRLRLYAALGLDTFQVIRVISFTTVSFWLGLLSLAGLSLLFEAPTLAQAEGASTGLLHLAGLLLLSVPAFYFAAVFLVKRPLRFRQWRFPLPSGGLACTQLLLALIDWLLTAAIFWVLLPDHHGLPIGHFLAFFLIAQILAVISHVPGGLGVFEASILALLAPTIPAAETAIALVLFRALFYLLPLLLSAIGLVLIERRTLARVVTEVDERLSPMLGLLVPRVLAIATFLAGAVLLVTGSIPPLSGRLAALDRFIPLGFLETSHLLSGVVGIILLILANGLRRRLDGAWHVAVWALVAGIVAALLRALDFEEASLLTVVLVMLLLSKRHFYRKDRC